MSANDKKPTKPDAKTKATAKAKARLARPLPKSAVPESPADDFTVQVPGDDRDTLEVDDDDVRTLPRDD